MTRNAYVWGAIVLCIGILAVAALQPTLAQVLSLAPLPLEAWLANARPQHRAGRTAPIRGYRHAVAAVGLSGKDMTSAPRRGPSARGACGIKPGL